MSLIGSVEETYRSLFRIPPGWHYLNCAYMAPLARPVEAAGIAALRRQRIPWQIGPESFFQPAEQVRERFARLIGLANPDRVAVLPSVSYGMAILTRNVPLGRGQEIILPAEDFPSSVYPWARLAQEQGGLLRMIPPPTEGRDRGRRWNERLLEAISTRTAVVLVPPVHWTDGTRFDLEAIGRRAREVGACFVVDGTQAIGALPWSIEAVRPDALLCAGYKWLLGPYGVTVGYFGPRFEGAVPLEESWLNRQGSEDFARLVEYPQSYRPGARRFDVGQRSPVLLSMLAEALSLLLRWGPEAISRHARRLAEPFWEAVSELGYEVNAEPYRTPHLFGLRGIDAQRLRALGNALRRCRICVSIRGTVLRISLHLYNQAEDTEALLEVLRRLR